MPKRKPRVPVPRGTAAARELAARLRRERSPAMRRALEQAIQVAASRSPVLIEGEPGTGKRRLAQSLHQSGPRRTRPFVWVACETQPSEEAEAELFGRDEESGDHRPGQFERAEGGTLFLDEVAALPAAAQATLLRALHDGGFVPLGGGEPHRSDVRLIASTSRDLAREVAEGRFRADLSERLGLVRVRIPPLRERREDLGLLAAELLAEIGRGAPARKRGSGRRAGAVTPGALERLAAHDWPGNVSELRDVLEAAVAARKGRGPLGVGDLPPALRGGPAPRGIEAAVGMTVAEVERRLIEATLEHAGGDKPRAAALLGIGLRTLYRKVREFGLD